MSELTLKEIERYQRHLSLPSFGKEAQLKLKAARVLVIGAGGLGCPALQYLAAAGVGKLGVMDFDLVDASNLQRQILFTEGDVGKPKASVAADRLRAMNSNIDVVDIAERLSEENALQIFQDYDLIVDGSDNFVTRYLVNDACVMTKKPLIYGAIYTFQGQVSVFNFQGGPTYRCLFPDPPDPKDAPNCSEIGVIGILPGLIGTLQASEAIKVITGVGEPLSGSLLLWDVLTMKQQTIRFGLVPESLEITELRETEFVCSVESTPETKEEVDAGELAEWLGEGRELQILDVREDWERALLRMESLHIPLGTLLFSGSAPEAMGISPSKPLVIYCASGGRSLKATRELKEVHGFSRVWSLNGGMKAWAESGGEVVKSGD
jgi:adenylyltransferase/sulfurtransferase